MTKPRQHIKKQRRYFANRGSSSQSYDFFGSHVEMWEFDHKEGWAPKNWCFWAVVVAKTLESPLDCKEIKLVHPKGNQSWIFIGRTDAEARALIFSSWDAKSQLIGIDSDAGKEWGQEEKGVSRGWDGWMASLTQCMWVWVNSRKITVKGREAWSAAAHGVATSQTWLSDWTTTT